LGELGGQTVAADAERDVLSKEVRVHLDDRSNCLRSNPGGKAPDVDVVLVGSRLAAAVMSELGLEAPTISARMRDAATGILGPLCSASRNWTGRPALCTSGL
jgi:hypothetical protein